MSTAPLSDASVAFIEREVAIDLGACGQDGRASTCRGFAARVAPDRRRGTVLVRRAEAAQLLQDVLATDRVAVVLCLPETEASIQLKGRRVSLRPTEADDDAALLAYCARFVEGVVRLGYARAFAQAYMAADAAQMVALGFTVEQVFDQTPGPRAGQRQEGATP